MHRDPGGRRFGGLILAAGLSRRMGAFKPLLPLGDRTVLETAAASLLDGGVSAVTVVLGHRRQEVEVLLRRRYGGDVLHIAENPQYAQSDMFASVKAGLAVLPPCDAFFLLPGDMPLVKETTLRTLAQALPEDGPAVVFPAIDGFPKHPPLIHSRLIPAILSYEGAEGLRGFWQLHRDLLITVPVEDSGCQTDLDTREQYLRCLAARGERNR